MFLLCPTRIPQRTLIFIKNTIFVFKRTRIFRIYRMWIKPSSKKLQLQSPSGSFVLFERFVFVKSPAVCGLSSRAQRAQICVVSAIRVRHNSFIFVAMLIYISCQLAAKYIALSTNQG